MAHERDIYRKAARECLGNALNLSESAEILHNSSKVGVATSLLVLASEELAKAEIYGSMADDIISVNKDDLGKKYVLDRKILRDHTTKEVQFMGYNFVSAYVKLLGNKDVSLQDVLSFFEDSMRGKPVDIKNPISKLTFSQQEYDEFTKGLKEQEVRSNALFGNMDELKLRGFYVDITEEGITSPKRLGGDTYNKLNETFNQALEAHSVAISYGIPEPLKEELMKSMEPMIKNQKKPLYSDLKHAKTTLGKDENYEKITKGQAIRLSRLCMENSRSLFEASQILANDGKGYNNNGLFGTASALLAISREEYVKAVIFAMVYSGYAVITRKPVKGQYAIHPSQIKCHSCKDSLAAWNDVTTIAKTTRLPKGASPVQETEELKMITNSPIPEGKDGAFLGMGVPPEKLEEVKNYFDLASNLWGLKEIGLYVFVSEDRVQSPANFHPIMYRVVEGIVARSVLPNHPFEDYANLNLEKVPDFLLIGEEEMITPTICPHRGSKRIMSHIIIYKDSPSN